MDDFAAPEKNLSQVGLKEGMTVADLGAGAGFYAFAASKLVGHTGRVYAIEVQRDLMTRIKNEVRARRLGNIEVLLGDIEEKGGTKLRDRLADVVILSNVLFQLEDKKGAFLEARRILKPNGTLLVVDWADSYGGMGPQPAHIIKADAARQFAEGAGFVYKQSITAGTHHYGFLMTTP